MAADTITVTAEGLADPNAETYQRDKGLMIDDLRQDARRQVIEKAVGAFIDSTTLVENYVLLEDRVFSQSTGLIKRVIKESNPWLGEDGFMHMLIQAEVFVTGVEEALKEMSRSSRVGYIRQYGDPKISVAVYAQDAARGSWESRSEIAENILKEHISGFGYRVWSEEMTKKLKSEMMEASTLDNQVEATVSVSHLKASDFSIYGTVKFDVRSVTLQASGVNVKKNTSSPLGPSSVSTTIPARRFTSITRYHGAIAGRARTRRYKTSASSSVPSSPRTSSNNVS
jgi:serine/threonine-protein kinase